MILDLEDEDSFWHKSDKLEERKPIDKVLTKQDSEANPKKMLEEASNELLKDMEYADNTSKMFSDTQEQVVIKNTPLLKCYD